MTSKQSENSVASSHPLRVCHVVVSLERLGGHSIAASRLIEAFSLAPETGIEGEILPINPPLPGFIRVLGEIKYIRTIVNTIAYLILLFLKLPRYDVVQVYSASYFSFIIAPAPAVLIAKLYGKPVILHYHSGEAEDHLRRWPLSTRLIFGLSDEIVVPSHFLVDIFARFGFKTRAIFNLVDFNRYKFRERAPLHPKFITNRLHEPPYNIPCALKAFALIQAEYPEAELTVVGDGWMRPQFEAMAKELELRNTVFTGRVSLDEMPRYYDENDFYLNPTNVDNMPSSITESFACGLVVITTNVGGIPYILSHEQTGFMVEPDSPVEMATCATTILRDQTLAQNVIKDAYQECLKYSWSRVSPEWIKLYRRLAPSPATQPHGSRLTARAHSSEIGAAQTFDGSGGSKE